MRAVPVALTLSLLASLPSLAAAAPDAKVDPKKDRSHRLQAGVGVTVGSGYRVQFKYSEAGSCGQNDEQTQKPRNSCSDRLPTWLDLKIFFGVSHAVELIVEQRFSLEKNFTTNTQFMLMPGIRVYAEGARKEFKFFVQLQGIFDYSNPGAFSGTRFDYGFHEANGFQWDFLKWMGAYFQISESFLFARSFTFQIEAGLGVEGRFP